MKGDTGSYCLVNPDGVAVWQQCQFVFMQSYKNVVLGLQFYRIAPLMALVDAALWAASLGSQMSQDG